MTFNNYEISGFGICTSNIETVYEETIAANKEQLRSMAPRYFAGEERRKLRKALGYPTSGNIYDCDLTDTLEAVLNEVSESQGNKFPTFIAVSDGSAEYIVHPSSAMTMEQQYIDANTLNEKIIVPVLQALGIPEASSLIGMHRGVKISD